MEIFLTIRVDATLLAALTQLFHIGQQILAKETQLMSTLQDDLDAISAQTTAIGSLTTFCQESGELLIATMFRAHPDYSGGVSDALKSGGIAEWLGDRKTAYIAFSGRAPKPDWGWPKDRF